jgi:hypothetical protein
MCAHTHTSHLTQAYHKPLGLMHFLEHEKPVWGGVMLDVCCVSTFSLTVHAYTYLSHTGTCDAHRKRMLSSS